MLRGAGMRAVPPPPSRIPGERWELIPQQLCGWRWGPSQPFSEGAPETPVSQGDGWRPSKDVLDPLARGNKHLTCWQREGSEAHSPFLLKDPEYLRQARSQAGYC